MKKEILFILIVITIVLVGGCTKQTPRTLFQYKSFEDISISDLDFIYETKYNLFVNFTKNNRFYCNKDRGICPDLFYIFDGCSAELQDAEEKAIKEVNYQFGTVSWFKSGDYKFFFNNEDERFFNFTIIRPGYNKERYSDILVFKCSYFQPSANKEWFETSLIGTLGQDYRNIEELNNIVNMQFAKGMWPFWIIHYEESENQLRLILFDPASKEGIYFPSRIIERIYNVNPSDGKVTQSIIEKTIKTKAYE